MMWIDDPLVRIRPLTPDRYAELHALEKEADRDGLWRFGGTPPDFDAYVPTLWANVAGQCGLFRPDGQLVGMVMVYDLDLRNGTVWIATMAADEARGRGVALVATGQVITTLFRDWGLRRVCAEVMAPNLDQFASVLDRYGTEFGRLRADRPVGDELVDVVLFGIDRDVWRRESEPRMLRRRRRLQGSPSAAGLTPSTGEFR
jgi:RimJ/RimL family protein N-acetyltransferase